MQVRISTFFLGLGISKVHIVVKTHYYDSLFLLSGHHCSLTHLHVTATLRKDNDDDDDDDVDSSVICHLMTLRQTVNGSIQICHKVLFSTTKLERLLVVVSSPFLPSQEHRPSTVSLPSLLSCASLSSSYQLLPVDLISASSERLQVFHGRPLFPWFNDTNSI